RAHPAFLLLQGKLFQPFGSLAVRAPGLPGSRVGGPRRASHPGPRGAGALRPRRRVDRAHRLRRRPRPQPRLLRGHTPLLARAQGRQPAARLLRHPAQDTGAGRARARLPHRGPGAARRRGSGEPLRHRVAGADRGARHRRPCARNELTLGYHWRPMSGSPIYGTSGIRELEARAGGQGGLMQRAGLAAAEFARSLCGDTAKSILVLAGPGNNGGDALEVAAHLKRWFFRVSVVFAGERDKLSPDARAALAKWESAGGTLLDELPRG